MNSTTLNYEGLNRIKLYFDTNQTINYMTIKKKILRGNTLNCYFIIIVEL